jgi:cobalamin synthase
MKSHMRLIGAAFAFLTRVPINPKVPFDAGEVGKSTRWYPLVGALIGGLTSEFYGLAPTDFHPLSWQL